MKRKFIPGVPNHCYQKTQDGALLFYSISDYLACFTYICISAIRNRVRITALALMPDHIHIIATAGSEGSLTTFVKEYSSPFARLQNEICNKGRRLFKRSFGSAPKIGEKAIRSCIIYVGNNPVERRLCRLAEEYRWNFLAYAQCAHPFSEEYIRDKASVRLRNAMAEVSSSFRRKLPLKYALVRRLFSTLNKVQRNQLADFIVTTYNVIDYGAAAGFFDSYEDMIEAMHVTTGSEHDIKEEFTGWSDSHYAKMIKLTLQKYEFDDIHEITSIPEEEKLSFAIYLQQRTQAPRKQIMKFLRLPLDR